MWHVRAEHHNLCRNYELWPGHLGVKMELFPKWGQASLAQFPLFARGMFSLTQFPDPEDDLAAA